MYISQVMSLLGASWPEAMSCLWALAEVGSFRVNPRFHPTDVGWNLWLPRKLPLSCMADRGHGGDAAYKMRDIPATPQRHLSADQHPDAYLPRLLIRQRKGQAAASWQALTLLYTAKLYISEETCTLYFKNLRCHHETNTIVFTFSPSLSDLCSISLLSSMA